MICAIIEPKNDKARVERFEEGGFALAEELQIRIPRIDVDALRAPLLWSRRQNRVPEIKAA